MTTVEGKKELLYQQHLRAYYRPVECLLSILLFSQYKGIINQVSEKKLDQKNTFQYQIEKKKHLRKKIEKEETFENLQNRKKTFTYFSGY